MRHLLILPLLFLCGCGSLFYAQIEEPDLCKSVSADFPAVVAPAGSESVSVDLDVRSELESFQRPDSATHLKLKYLQFQAVRGIQDFGFVDTAKINVEGTSTPACNIPALVDYHRDASATPQPTLTFQGPDLIDLAACLSAEKVTLKTDFAGRLPSNDWSMTVKTCLSGTARINYLGGK